MADELDDEVIFNLDIRREASAIKQALMEVLEHGERFEYSVLIGTALAFAAACEEAEVDEFAVLEQVLDRFPDGEIDLSDDPAGGRFVHAPVRA